MKGNEGRERKETGTCDVLRQKEVLGHSQQDGWTKGGGKVGCGRGGGGVSSGDEGGHNWASFQSLCEFDNLGQGYVSSSLDTHSKLSCTHGINIQTGGPRSVSALHI